jgi:hypothetical protein
LRADDSHSEGGAPAAEADPDRSRRQQPQQAAVGSGNVANQQSTSNQQATGRNPGQKSTTTSPQEHEKEKMAARGR